MQRERFFEAASFYQEETGRRLKSYRMNCHLTVEKEAEMLGISINAIYKWERGECAPDISNLCSLAKLFDVQIDELLVYY